ncbi:EamA family transporter [Ornithinimicrobium faecis]|uniref:EamA family transporter n=1 Tax=Ornithinimicrobium faecis TaxID=2934158 RepID=UPI0021186617|nr:EamA family transporter [Ornithinimicrobium sp. HY1745]
MSTTQRVGGAATQRVRGATTQQTGGAATTLSTALAPIVWGTTYVVTTLFLPPDHPLWSGALRALPAGLIAVALARHLPRGSWWWKALVLGTLNIGAFFPLLFLAAYLLPGGVAAIFGAAGPLFVAVLAVPLLGERATRWRLGWGVLAVGGVALIVLGPGAALSPTGVLAGVASTVSMALGTVLSKRWGRPVGPVAYAGWQLTAGGLAILPVAFLLEGPPPELDDSAIAGYAWLSLVGALLAYTLWFRGVGHLPAGAVAFLPVLSPLVAALLGWVVLAEALSPVQLAGFALALVAVSSAQRQGPPVLRRHQEVIT